MAIFIQMLQLTEGKLRNNQSLNLHRQTDAEFADLVNLEEGTILEIDPIFSRDALDSLMDKDHRLDQSTRGMKPYATNTDITREAEKGQSSYHLYKKIHNMNHCKNFLNLRVDERSRYLAMNKLRFGCYDPL